MSSENRFVTFFADMTFWQFVLLACFLYGSVQVGGRYYKAHEQKRMMSQVMQTESEWAQMGVPSSCKNKNKCITVYIAPWCGVCRQTEPTLRALFLALPRLRPDVGFGIVIGGDSPGNHLKKQQELVPMETLIDETGTILDKRGVHAFPTWIINDKDGNELFRQAAGFNATTDQQLEEILSTFFKI
jgi:thiol-disulfide isomerase/thioredoxin